MAALNPSPAPDNPPAAASAAHSDPVGRLIEDIVVQSLLDDLDLPHVVVCGSSTGIITLTGPFPTALAALEAAAREEAHERAQDPQSDLTFGVRALNPIPERA
jgi:hypothetical protein